MEATRLIRESTLPVDRTIPIDLKDATFTSNTPQIQKVLTLSVSVENTPVQSTSVQVDIASSSSRR